MASASAPESAVRTTLLDAMRAQMHDRAWGEVSMADVARAAGVSRQTLYNEFGTRNEFAQAFVMREADRFLTGVEQAVRENLDDPVLALSAALTQFLVGAADDPFVRTVTAGADGAEELLPLLTVEGQPLLVHAAERLGSFLIDGFPDVDEDDARLLARNVVRLAISYTAAPEGDDPRTTAREIARLFEPFVRQATGR